MYDVHVIFSDRPGELGQIAAVLAARGVAMLSQYSEGGGAPCREGE